jgi:hypothetical protein
MVNRGKSLIHGSNSLPDRQMLNWPGIALHTILLKKYTIPDVQVIRALMTMKVLQMNSYRFTEV